MQLEQGLRSIAERMRAATTFCEIAAIVLIESLERFPAAGGAMELHAGDEPLVCVASAWFDPVTLKRYLDDAYRHDPCLHRIRDTLTPLVISDVLSARQARELAATYGCPDASTRHTALAPLVGDGALVGVLRVAFETAVTPAVREALGLLAGLISVRLAQLGFAPTRRDDCLAPLTARQRQVAELVASGLRNAEIAAEIGVSIDAVKKHVKLALDTLDLGNRAELAAVVARAARQAAPPVGGDPSGFHVLRGRCVLSAKLT